METVVKKITFILAQIIFIKICSFNAWALPACPSDPEEEWDNCQGEYTSDSGDIYIGEWKNDEMHGQGTYHYSDGSVYTGEWKNNDMHGQGTYNYSDGSEYTGEWKNDDMHGQGTYNYSDGGAYTGEWKNDERSGDGIFTYKDGTEVVTKNGIIPPPKGLFSVVENKLFYDTENNDLVDQIQFVHAKNLFEILKSNEQIDTLVLNSSGGYLVAAHNMADLVIDAGLDTHITEECLSACVTIFLAGKNRSLALGGKIGFHKGSWAGSDIEDYYNREKKDEKWADPFEFASWLYEDTQADVFKKFEYLLERGVKPSFAIKTLKADVGGMWKPRRAELISGGILTR